MSDIYQALRALWFKLDPETSQTLALAILGGLGRTHPLDQYMVEAFRSKLPLCPVRVMGIDFPNPIGVFYCVDEPIYEVMLNEQIQFAIKNKGKGNIQALLDGADNWVVE